MHLGLIGGIGPAATEFYYRNLVKTHKDAGAKLELTICHAETDILINNMIAGKNDAQADVFLTYVDRMKSAGCDAVAVTSMAGHFCINELIERSPLPVINAIPALDAHFISKEVRTIGILGSGTVMKTHVYGGIPSVDVILPQGEDFEKVSTEYMNMARAGHATAEQRTYMFDIGKQMHTHYGADAVLLGGTDLFLAFDGQSPGFPVIDAALVHVDALFKQSTL
ncbi:aspartate/glutamate racemase family protein [Kordiimonas aquimaris]|uniref:aspartate/glutamate racemase family protein n=1 Tax=Kordiimonas aquimaris TaxID=707591 RepID=UPI0021D11E02|nr:aspartate/glutamate racemase family protein [Kordiimonas aquimaris]